MKKFYAKMHMIKNNELEIIKNKKIYYGIK